MILTLIGMSGTGKSYWSKKLESQGFRRFGCDDLITAHLAKKLNLSDMNLFNMHQWVGYPDEESYDQRAMVYLQTEEEILQEIIAYLENSDPEENIVIDSTGSVIYMPERILTSLAALSKIIYLDITTQDFDMMLKYYLENPVAIIWNGYFQPYANEDRSQTFKRCHPKLIHSREEQYKQLAQLIVPATFHRSPETSTKDFLSYIQSQIPE